MEENTQQVQNSAIKVEDNQQNLAGKTVKPKRKIPTSGNGWINDLKKAFETNER